MGVKKWTILILHNKRVVHAINQVTMTNSLWLIYAAIYPHSRQEVRHRRNRSIGLSQIRHSPFSDFSPRPNKGGSAQSRHVTRLLAQICNAELTAGHSELKYWVYFSTFCDIDFYTQFHIQ